MIRTILEILVGITIIGLLLFGVWSIITPSGYEQMDLRYFDNIDTPNTEKLA
jgi:hypothetical protein